MPSGDTAVASILAAERQLTNRYSELLQVNTALDRRLVSFQANRAELANRWFKYREGFSAALMRYVFERVSITEGVLLDPFAGSGTALFAAAESGVDAVGIELLPSSIEGIEVRRLLSGRGSAELSVAVRAFACERVWESSGPVETFPHLRITRGAFPEETERLLGRYMYEASRVDDDVLGRVLKFAALCVLESISYTRKDGQYLRWDYRSGRSLGARLFDKGYIQPFTDAIVAKLQEIAHDISLNDGGHAVQSNLFALDRRLTPCGNIKLLQGSCLEIMPTLLNESFDAIVTSPPYCNRYDYTRTYALELAMLGVGEDHIKYLRQTMLSCTVENREKVALARLYPDHRFEFAVQSCLGQETLQLILSYLDSCRENGLMNNAGIPRMVRNYFMEMALVIFEAARILKPGAPFVMVNDNVRYQGVHIPVDLILSDIARSAGFDVEKIWVLPRGKGNSSQQMGSHGREEIRKCVYVWRRSTSPRAIQPDRQLALAR